MSKKVLIIITTSFVPYGGLTTVMMNYYRAMDKTGLQIDFASTNDPPKVLLDELKVNGSGYFNIRDRKKQLPKYLKNLRAVLKNGHYDVVHVNGNSATMAFDLKVAKKYGVPVRIAHGHNTRTSHPILNKMLGHMFRRAYTYPIAVSKLAGDWLYNGDKYIVLKNAIDLKKYKFDELQRKIIRNNLEVDDKLVIGNVGKLNEQKNQIFLLDIFCDLKKIRDDVFLLLVGGGHLEKHLKEECKNRGIDDQIIFTGMVDNAAKYFQAMDVFVFPSLWEGLPLALIEAQTAGLPCLVSSDITKDAICTEHIQYKPLRCGSFSWAEDVVKMAAMNIIRHDATKEVGKHGFDIQEEAKKLRKIYLGGA